MLETYSKKSLANNGITLNVLKQIEANNVFTNLLKPALAGFLMEFLGIGNKKEIEKKEEVKTEEGELENSTVEETYFPDTVGVYYKSENGEVFYAGLQDLDFESYNQWIKKLDDSKNSLNAMNIFLDSSDFSTGFFLADELNLQSEEAKRLNDLLFKFNLLLTSWS